MRVFITGATGFIGGATAARLRDRGDDVVALVRSPGKASDLAARGCELVEGSLSDTEAITAGMAGADAVIHCAADYRVGMHPNQKPDMFEANVRGTEAVLRAAHETGVGRVVYVSTVAYFGNTQGRVVDETYERGPGYTSYYDETKHKAHLVAREVAQATGLPLVTVMPGAVYGPHDTSAIGIIMRQFLAGKMPAYMFPEAGFTFVHRDDVVDGILLALDKGVPGEEYTLGGETLTTRDAIEKVAQITGKRPPRITMPPLLIKASAPLGRFIGPMMGQGPNIRELITSAHNVTFWAGHEKATRELGYSPRPFEQGLRDTLREEGIPTPH
ncbi:MAG: NAD-dependent epimerase/dehydratase family protein [Actinomycetota bacterium]